MTQLIIKCAVYLVSTWSILKVLNTFRRLFFHFTSIKKRKKYETYDLIYTHSLMSVSINQITFSMNRGHICKNLFAYNVGSIGKFVTFGTSDILVHIGREKLFVYSTSQKSLDRFKHTNYFLVTYVITDCSVLDEKEFSKLISRLTKEIEIEKIMDS